MAALLNDDRRFWAVDKLCLGYLAFSTVLVTLGGGRIAGATAILAGHAAAALLIIGAAASRGRAAWLFRNWYPLVFVSLAFREMALIIPAVRGWVADQWLAGLDFAFWHAHPTVWLERMMTPPLTEFLQVVYSLFIPAVLAVPVILWWQRRYDDFRAVAFVIALGYLVSYVGYFIVPARGPRILLHDLQTVPLAGGWLFDMQQRLLDRLESTHYDCFPSGHTELTILAWWCARLISARLFLAYAVYTICIMFATVYLRYHYSVDVLAGVLTAAVLIAVAPPLYRTLSPEP
ncbi:MAG TPA: phosphatase PAP2 family protein [Gemmatimonadaceae bacterium]|nr:phosphatase PAP2 family protein [Gemmatimonadaceae bacterium]